MLHRVGPFMSHHSLVEGHESIAGRETINVLHPNIIPVTTDLVPRYQH